jgi:DNA-binding transcriptional ArsR family regulator
MMNQLNELAQFYKALGDETRLRLVQLLAQQKPGHARCVGSLAKAFGTTASNVSQHLKLLKDLGLVEPSRRGYRIHYYLNQDRIAEYDHLRAELLNKTITTLEPIDELEEINMSCKQDPNCKHPERKPNNENCTSEQIEKCHGENAEQHCCENQ